MPIPTPQDFFGFRPGDDRKLARWPRIVEYFELLAKQSGRIRVQRLGQTTEGRPFISAVITSEQNMERLEELRGLHCRLADPRGLDPVEAEGLLGKARAVVMISCSIHASEVGGTQMSSELAWELCAQQDEVTRQVLENVIFVFVPSLNPDGLEMVADYYQSTLGQPWEGGMMPWLYHKYVGHDNNRDWFMLTQVENQLAVEKVHNVWHPMIVFDQHQMGPQGFRFFLPPYIDPFDPNVDPLLRHETTVVGAAMIMELLAAGRYGVTHSVIFDCFSPSRAYQHYHGGIRILSECASVKIATPIEIKAQDLEIGRDGTDPRVATVAHPIPWRGGSWKLRDIIEYDKIAAWACLKHAARYRDMWVRNFHKIAVNSLNVSDPCAFLVPPAQRDPVTAQEMLVTLRKGMVEVHRARGGFEADGVPYPAGTYVILTAQPYGRYAKTLLERQTYPDLRQYPGGPPKPPYDITAHTLPLGMGVRSIAVKRPFDADLEPLAEIPLPVAVAAGTLRAGRSEHGFTICPAMNASFKAVNRLLKEGYEVSRTLAPVGPEGRESPGAFYVKAKDGLVDLMEDLAAKLGLRVSAADPRKIAGLAALRLRQPRLGLYRSYAPTADEGWTRFVLEEYGFSFQTLLNDAVRAGGLAKDYDSIILPGQSPTQISDGLREGLADPKYTGGLGEAGREALHDFVHAGGTLICLGPACDWATVALGLRVRNVLQGLKPEEFYLPGSMLRASFDQSHPVAFGMPAEATVLHVGSPAFEALEGRVVARYAPSAALQSGWILGEKHVLDRAAVVEAPCGRGHVVLLGPRVQFRAQTRGTYKLLFNAIYLGCAKGVNLP